MTQAVLRVGGQAVLARSLPFALYIVFLALDPWLVTALPKIIDVTPLWLYALRIGTALGALVFFRGAYGELSLAPVVERGDWVLAALLGVGVFLAWITLDSGWAVFCAPMVSFVPVAPDGSLQWSLIVLRIFGAAAVVPLMEELFWRSFVQRWIDSRDFLALAPSAGSWLALWLASLVFGFEHGQWLAGLMGGLAYGFLYRCSGSLWPPIAAHALTNFLLGVWVVITNAWKFW